MADSRYLGLKLGEMKAREQAWDDAQPMVARCIHCPEFYVEGPAAEARQQAEDHRREHHPKTFRKTGRPQNRNLHRFVHRNMTKEQEEEVDRARRVRMRALGLDPDLL